MAYKVVVSPAASHEIIESIGWYNKARSGLGLKFYKQIQDVFSRISHHPHAYAMRYKNHRTVVLTKFPFMVHYFVDDEKKTVIVTAVLHTSRDPNKWDETRQE